MTSLHVCRGFMRSHVFSRTQHGLIRAGAVTKKPSRIAHTFSSSRVVTRDVHGPRFFATVGAAAVATPQLEENARPEKTLVDAYLHGGAGPYVDEMYRMWLQSPDTVHESWHDYFESVEQGSELTPSQLGITQSSSTILQQQTKDVLNHLKVQQLVRAYQSRGHYLAKTDPLGLRTDAEEIRPRTMARASQDSNELDPSFYGFTDSDLDQSFTLGPELLPGFATDARRTMTLRDIISACQATYCGSYGVEYQHLPDSAQRDWLRTRLEVPTPVRFTRAEKRQLLDDLLGGTLFERFLAAKFPNEKRFGLDGGESLVPAVKALINQCADVHGVEDVVIGSCHRGRLTMLGTVYGKAGEKIFAEFAGRIGSDVLPAGTAGDVKYHLGHDGECVTTGGQRVSLSLLANPSHLEAVDPVATGKAYATQLMRGDNDKKRVLCLALHGDAAFAGQGVVYETLGLSRLPAYDVGGTIRLIVNNQVGFTTDVHHSRSTSYASDIAKYIHAPIFHVNADDVEAVAHVCRIAADWRAEFGTDVVVDLICYRRFGHNEMDQPSFTQPLMYQQVGAQTPSLEQYVDKLVSEGTVSEEEVAEQKTRIWNGLQQQYDESKGMVSERHEDPELWQELALSELDSTLSSTTAVEKTTLSTIMDKMTRIPTSFHPHTGLKRVIASREKAFTDGSLDWSTAEALAFGSLCLEGNPVRVTGQDVQRGTFSQRHAAWHDQTTGKVWTPLRHLHEDQAPLTLVNSPLSEFGALGFEYGMTLADPSSLIMWEAQFGDFANNTQVIIDNFIASGESKWLDKSGIILSLPHGYDGQGAEHSSARLERFLMLCSQDGRSWPADVDSARREANMDVVYPTTPANYFHVLRRQVRRGYRKPMILLFSKSLLRHPLIRSNVEELTGSSTFKPVLTDPAHGDTIGQPDEITKVVYCTGQVYVSLKKHREALGLRDVAITRIEELHPFPWTEVKENWEMYPNAKNVVWAQEEHYNGGAWHYMRDRLDTVLREVGGPSANARVVYAGRGPSASTAAGLKRLHAAEEEDLLNQAFSV